IDRSGTKLREASYDLGANKVKTFLKVTLPMAMPGVISGCLLVFIPLNGDYVPATVLGGASGSMVGQLIAEQFNAAQNWAVGPALGGGFGHVGRAPRLRGRVRRHRRRTVGDRAARRCAGQQPTGLEGEGMRWPIRSANR